MIPYYSDDWLTVYQGDCREVMASMEPESVHCVVTSPRYWGLRDYGTPDQVWDGELVCVDRKRQPAHTWGPDGRCESDGCDSWCGPLGLEPTPELFVRNLVSVFREVRRVLRSDGTVWLNLGDSYATDRGGAGQPAETLAGGMNGRGDSGSHRGRKDGYNPSRDAKAFGLKGKDLVGIPWMVAFALRSDGWYLRSDIIWSKLNPMPESVTDRPTKSHEYLFLLSKSARYYFDADAVAERMAESSVERLSQAGLEQQEGSWLVPGKTNGPMKAVGRLTGGAYAPPGQSPSSNARPTWQDRKAAGAHPGGHGGGDLIGTGTQRNVHGEGMTHDLGDAGTRNIRSVWTIATQPYPGAHFATFPPKLVEPCVKAGSPSGGVVLDPFGGSGTTGMVAQALGRRAVLIDLNGDYLVQAMRRNQQSPLGLDVA